MATPQIGSSHPETSTTPTTQLDRQPLHDPIMTDTQNVYHDADPAVGRTDTTLEDINTPYRIPVHHVFDVDTRTGFMASIEPPSRLPQQWQLWEATLDNAIQSKLQIGDKIGITEDEERVSREWRKRVRELQVLSIEELKPSAVLLRRAHLVLTYILHFYIQSIPPTEAILIPQPLSLPLLRVSQHLDIPPLLTFSDTVLYNWTHRTKRPTSPDGTPQIPEIDNLRTQTMFTNLTDEEEFYLCSARIELRGVEALEIMRLTMDETFVDDEISVRRITSYLSRLSEVIGSLKDLLLDVRKGCDPDVYYNDVRPWFRGEDSDLLKRKWVFEGVDEDPTLSQPEELSGPSAGQSSMVHVLDIFLGVDHQSSATSTQPSFMSRMQKYMPHNHRLFLNHLKTNPRPLREFVKRVECSLGDAGGRELGERYNEAVMALKEFRDAHMIIAALYILGPARRVAAKSKAGAPVTSSDGGVNPRDVGSGAAASVVMGTGGGYDVRVASPPAKVKGTGGTDLVKFLKDTRNRTQEAMIQLGSKMET
ncbi:Indoleamine 2,3-dioxygenase [Pluteus cervinus]|uniref:Indoleamine 2,3-dioxygenase n=1 Tax=Pluteus cervinus TaxID=181527 RepID=A0ACD3A5W2_9AGAR|nr:Indoleamine 2,3-dioxygenase [Pluteus cervinus]